MTLYTPQDRIIILGSGLQVVSKASDVAPWYLAGGISAANCLAAYQPKGAASLAASYSNLANPGTYNAAPGVAPTFDASTGWTFNGSTQYLTTGITTAPIRADWSFFVRFSNNTGPLAFAVGSYSSGYGSNFGIWAHVFGSYRYCYYNYTEKASAPSAATLAVAGTHGFLNGTNEATITGSGSGVDTYPDIFIGAQNNGSGTAQYKFTGKIQAIAIYNTVLSDAQVAAVTTAMNAL